VLEGGFRLLDHTADTAILVWGRDLAVLFQMAARAMLSLVVNPDQVRVTEKSRVAVSAESLEELLLRWLREILYEMEQKGKVFSQVSVEKDKFSYKPKGTSKIEGFLGGEALDLERHDICSEIKAVTRHRFDIQRRGPGWEAIIVFDV
jgi:SHS2 domain-containing protein